MFSPTRFPGGITNANQGQTLSQFGAPDPSLFHSFFNDFDTFATADWTLTEIGAGGAAALIEGDGGLLQLTTDALDNDAIQLQNTVASFLLESGKQTWFKTRCKIEKATQSDFLIGLCATDTTVFDVTDGIFFQKDDEDANLDIYVKKDSTTGQSTEAAVGTIVADTFIVLGFYYDGKSSVYAYVDDVKVATLDASATYLPDAALAITMAYRNGEAGANDLTVDYILAAKAR